jgi:Cu2+-exporting ATPase
LAEVDTVVFDKTGTLTLGEPELVLGPSVTDSVLRRAAELAASSRHPYARAVLRAATARGLDIQPARGVAETSGLGLVHSTSDGEVRLGSALWCGAQREDGASLWFRAGVDEPVPLKLGDKLRPDAAHVAQALRSSGIDLELLSGDHAAEVHRVADTVGIEVRSARMLPADKLERLATLSSAGHKVLMIGDGLNDAPALAAAHASLSPANAADISQTAADAVFQGPLLTPILESLAVAREVRRMSLQNFAIAIGYNVVFVPLAVAGLVTPLIAAVAMSASSIAVIANAVRLKRKALLLGSWRSL